MNNNCSNCEKIMGYPVCKNCFLYTTELWFYDIKEGNNNKDKILLALHKSLVLDDKSGTCCAICRRGKTSTCFTCKFENFEKLLKTYSIFEDKIEDLLDLFDSPQTVNHLKK